MVVQGKNLEELAAATLETGDVPPCRYRKNTERLQAVIQMAEQCGTEAAHACQVTRLALKLFDQTVPLHGFSGTEHFLLQCAAMLHDIAVATDPLNHHKTSMQLILDDKNLPLKKRERRIVAAIARYHRKALPSMNHKPYAALSDGDRTRVRTLAGILRVADGLDRTHTGVVRDLSAHINHGEVIIRCDTAGDDAEEEVRAAEKKGRLFEEVFNRKLTVLTGGAAR